MFRWLHKLYANFMGYFWIPCPICDEMFGGHELKPPYPALMTSPTSGKCVCRNCIDEVEKRNAEMMANYKRELFVVDGPEFDGYVIEGVDILLEHIESYADDMHDGESIEFVIERKDMTNEELEELSDL